MPKFNRRQFVGSVGAGLLLAPFIDARTRRRPRRPPGRRSAWCCSARWAPTRGSGRPRASRARTSPRSSAMTQPLPAIKENVVLVEGMPEREPQRQPRGPRQPHRPGQRLLRRASSSVGGSVHRQQAGGVRRQPSHRVAAPGRRDATTAAAPAVLRRHERRQPADDRLAAVGVQHGVRRRAADGKAAPTAARAAQEHPRHHHGREHGAAGNAGQQREGEAGSAPRFDPAAGEQAHAESGADAGAGVHEADDARRRQHVRVHGRPGRAGGERDPPEHHRRTRSPATSPASRPSSTATTRS